MNEHTTLRGREVFRLVAGREISTRIRAKSFLIVTAVLAIVIIAIGLINRVVGGDDKPESIAVGLVGTSSEALDAALDAAAGDRPVTVTELADADAARAAVDDGDVDVVIVGADGQALFGDAVDDEVLAIVQQAWAQVEVEQGLIDSGLTPEQATDALSVTPLEPVTLDGDDEPSGIGVLTGTLAAILLFLSLQTFGSYVLTGVVEEKSTAVVEVLLVRARPDQLLAGKIAGIGVVALLQFVVIVVAGVIALAISGVTVPGEIWATLPMTIVWFLLGFALYSTLFALAGSLVSRQEDAAAAAAPIMYALVGAYLLVFVVGYVPESTISTVLSLLPPIAPLLMPMRMAAGAASTIEVVVALVLLILATFATWKFAARIYEQVLLRRGTRITWRQAKALLRNN